MPPGSEDTLESLVFALGEKIDALTDSVEHRFRVLTREISDLRVKFAEAQVLAVRVEQQQAELKRIEERFAREIQVALIRIKEIEEALTNANITNAAERAAMRQEHALAVAKLRTHRERWDTVKGLVVPVAVSLVVTLVLAALRGAFGVP